MKPLWWTSAAVSPVEQAAFTARGGVGSLVKYYGSFEDGSLLAFAGNTRKDHRIRFEIKVMRFDQCRSSGAKSFNPGTGRRPTDDELDAVRAHLCFESPLVELPSASEALWRVLQFKPAPSWRIDNH